MNQILFKQAVAYHQAQQWEQATFCYREIIQQSPDAHQVHHMLGVLLLQTGHANKAITHIKDAIKGNPKSPTYYSNLGAAYRAAQNWDDAEKAWNQVLNFQPNDPDTHFNLGTVHLAKGDRTEAKSSWGSAVQNAPDHYQSLRALAMMHHEDEKHSEAFEYARKAFRLKPDDEEIKSLLGKSAFDDGLIFRHRKKWKKARERFQLAAEHIPSSLGAWSMLSEAELKLGLLEAAFISCKAAIKLAPEQIELHHNMGNILRMSGQEEQAIEAYDRAVRLGATHMATHQALAVLRGEDVETNTQVVQALFDQYADHFDSHLMDKLDYRVPRLLYDLLPQKSSVSMALDLGCGTGLVAQFFEGITQYWVGVDLSAEMLAKTKDKNSYSELIHGEIVQYLKKETRQFPLIICADTLIYMAKVDEFFNQVASHLSQNGMFLFSTENSDGEDIILQKSERYALHPDYVRRCMKKNGLTVDHAHVDNLRRDGEKWIEGTVWLCSRSKDDASA